MKAIWNGKVIAESENTILLEGNRYFPANSIKHEYFINSEHTTICPWKGVASYFTLNVEGENNENAAWTYHNPKDAALPIKDFIAFWKGVKIEN